MTILQNKNKRRLNHLYWLRSNVQCPMSNGRYIHIFIESKFIRKKTDLFFDTYSFGLIGILSSPYHLRSLIKSGLSTLAEHVSNVDLPTGLRWTDCVGRISTRAFSQFTFSERQRKKLENWIIIIASKTLNKPFFSFKKSKFEI